MTSFSRCMRPLFQRRLLHPNTARFASSTTTTKSHVSPSPSEENKSRHDIVVDYQENSKTGHDGTAAQMDTAFSRESLTPEESVQQADKESREMGQGSNPLDISPANSEMSQVQDASKEGIGMENPKPKKESYGGSPKKGAAVGKKYEQQVGSNKGVQ